MPAIKESKKCSKCGEVKPIAAFHIDRSAKDQRKPSCRLCYNKVKSKWRANNSDKVNQGKRESYLRHREHYLAYNRSDKRRSNWFRWKLETNFGITVEDFETIMERQGGCCAICGRPPSDANGHKHKHRLHVDHDHATGLVRGLLCNKCNVGLGCFNDDLELFAKAVNYLRNSGETDEEG